MNDGPHQSHWENVYATKGEQDVSWFEETPDLSLRLIGDAGVPLDVAAVDIGAGASRLVDALVERGQAHVTVLDVSAVALRVAQGRLEGGRSVDWVVSDVTKWVPERRYGLWHDRAAFHFLTEPDDQRAYVAAMRRALLSDSIAIIGTFAPDGPEKCSGLPVVRYDRDSLAATLGPDFEPVGHLRHTHVTPWGSEQRFQFTTLRRV